VKRSLADILTAASNPNAERVDVVIGGLPPARKALVESGAEQVKRLSGGVAARGKAALLAMSDEEWDRLANL